ncbi:GNAT family N-acetyltransferase [Candidatus Poribacteria bacterium]|nr:GNAT family N-acetyltransferase [Candidatus Poribacteria bacterium]
MVLSNKDTAYIIKNLYPLYLHDLSEFADWKDQVPNEHGILEPDNPDVRTLVEHGEVFNSWWEKPDVLFPFLILVDGKPAGFAFIATPPYSAGGDYYVNEFFLLHPYRGKGIGERATVEIFDKFHGEWELFVLKKNLRAQAFWRKTIAKYMSGQFQEEVTGDGGGVLFRFNNRRDT